MVETSIEEEADLGPEPMEATGIGPTIRVTTHPLRPPRNQQVSRTVGTM